MGALYPGLRAVAEIVLFCTFAAGASMAMGDDKEVLLNLYSLQAEARGEVDNNYMQVELVVEFEDRDSAALASKVNETMQWALGQLASFPEIDQRTENYQTWPRYADSRIIGWRSNQTLRLGSVNFERTREALQTLQKRLQIRNMQFRPQDETRSDAEDLLISEALDNFKRRAAIVQQSMGALQYRIVHVNIDTGGHARAPRMRMETMARSASVSSAPAVEAGESMLSVTVSGQIQLQ